MPLAAQGGLNIEKETIVNYTMANGRLIPSGRSPIRIIAQIELPIAVSAIMTSVAVVPAYRFCDGIAGICSGVVVTIDI